ncbi:sensor histidine kinase [Paraburkholderia sp. 40]|uniref:sensor histidine kinase n=1 Tax=Paraburkholderia sp. 40 TaxID=2991059 RepID=UPI003D25D9DA
MFEEQRLFGLATNLMVGTVVFSLIAALIVFRFLTVRLRMLSESIEAFRASGFTTPVPLTLPGKLDDEIYRLSAAFQAMSERIAMQLGQLEQVDRQRRELLANVSHDLRTPLASMQGYLETMLIRADELTSEERNRYLQVAVKHCERLGKLVQDLFELTKLEAHEVNPQIETFPIAELAQDVVQKFALKAQKCQITLVAKCEPDCPPVRADIGMIERVLENLIENAMRYTPVGGEIGVEVRPAGARVELRVRDTGEGIRGEELHNIFDRYYRVDRSESGGTGNAGLGLAITRRIVELHGGDIQVESAPGLGTTFIVDLAVA